jgi:hypothetical protein
MVHTDTQLPGDEIHDLKLDRNRQVFVDDTGDLAQTVGVETVEQSVAIEAGDVLRPLVGEPLQNQTYEDIQQTLLEVLRADPQIDNVQRVEVSRVNKSSGTVFVDIFVDYNTSFEIEVTL